VRLVKAGAGGEKQCAHVLKISWPDDLGGIAKLGLTLADLQQEIIAAKAKGNAVRPSDFRSCGELCRGQKYQNHVVATLFGQVTVQLPPLSLWPVRRQRSRPWLAMAFPFHLEVMRPVRGCWKNSHDVIH
jgi:hypothetical protein